MRLFGPEATIRPLFIQPYRCRNVLIEFVERPISLSMAEVNLPGVLRRYDLPDLMAALGDRLTLVNPVSSIGEPLTVQEVAARAPGVSNIVLRSPRDPASPPAAFPSSSNRRAAR